MTTLADRLDEMLATAREAERNGRYVYRGKAHPTVFAALVECVRAAELVRDLVPHGPDRYELVAKIDALEAALEDK